MPSVLWHCWLDGRKGIWPVKNWVVECWRGYLSGMRCRFAYGPADATATHYLLLQYQIYFTFLVPAHPGNPGQSPGGRRMVVAVVVVPVYPLLTTSTVYWIITNAYTTDSSKSRLVLTFLVLPFWYLLTRLDPDIFQTSSKTVVCVCNCKIQKNR